MNKKAEGVSAGGFLLGGIILIILLFLVLDALFGFNIISHVKNIIPIFGGSEKAAEFKNIIGYNFEDDNLFYWTGAEWEKISLEKEPDFTRKKFNPAEIRNEIEKFYFFTERKPEIRALVSGVKGKYYDSPFFLLPTEENRQKALALAGTPNKRIKGGFAYNEPVLKEIPVKGIYNINELKCFKLDFFNKLIEGNCEFVYEGKDISGKLEYIEAIKEINAWRNQILKGGEAEKSISLEIDGAEQRFLVEKRRQYLIIDLNQSLNEDYKDIYNLYEVDNNGLSFFIASFKYSMDFDGKFYFDNELLPIFLLRGEIKFQILPSPVTYTAGALEQDTKLNIDCVLKFCGPDNIKKHLMQLDGRDITELSGMSLSELVALNPELFPINVMEPIIVQ